MANVWPTAGNFPATPLLSGAGETEDSTIIRTSMDVGPPKLRQRSTTSCPKHRYVFMLSTANVATMRTFYQTTCSGGAEVFEMTHPRTEVASTEFGFVSPPSYRPLGAGHWHMTIEIEEMPT